MSDSVTVLNTGVGGDSMDESRVLQSDGTTLAKRPRVVIGGDAGFVSPANDLVQPVSTNPGANPVSLPTLPQAIVNDASEGGFSIGELRPLSMTSDGRIRVSVLAARLGVPFFSAAQENAWDDFEGTYTEKENSPW